MTKDDVVGKTFYYQGQEHIVTQVREIQDEHRKKVLIYSDTTYPVSYDIIFEEHLVDIGV
jgi:hypothetical protein